jgi:hypothetical protein
VLPGRTGRLERRLWRSECLCGLVSMVVERERWRGDLLLSRTNVPAGVVGGMSLLKYLTWEHLILDELRLLMCVVCNTCVVGEMAPRPTDMRLVRQGRGRAAAMCI